MEFSKWKDLIIPSYEDGNKRCILWAYLPQLNDFQIHFYCFKMSPHIKYLVKKTQKNNFF